MDLSGFPEIIRAIETDRGFWALVLLLVASLSFYYFRRGPVWAQVFSLALLVFAAWLYSSAVRSLATAPHVGQPPTATAATPSREETVPFDSVGPYSAVGCNGRVESSTTYALPANAYEVQSKCEWIETSNLKEQPCATALEGSTVKATGSIVGRDTDWLGNCPGGGHGKLKLSGSYKHRVM